MLKTTKLAVLTLLSLLTASGAVGHGRKLMRAEPEAPANLNIESEAFDDDEKDVVEDDNADQNVAEDVEGASDEALPVCTTGAGCAYVKVGQGPCRKLIGGQIRGTSRPGDYYLATEGGKSIGGFDKCSAFCNSKPDCAAIEATGSNCEVYNAAVLPTLTTSGSGGDNCYRKIAATPAPTKEPTASPTKEPTAAPTMVPMHGCRAFPRNRIRTSNVPISAAGAEACKQSCSGRGYTYYGMECPMGGSGKVHCQCSNGFTGTTKDASYCEGVGNPLVNHHAHCTGPYTADGYRFGDANVGSEYLVAR